MVGLIKRYFPVLSLLLLIVSNGFAQDLREMAREAEKSGNNSQAIEYYLQWLDSNLKHQNSEDVFFHTLSLYDSAADVLKILEKYAPLLSEGGSAAAYTRMASLELLLGFPDQSADHYEKAAARSQGLVAHRLLMEALVLRYGMGEYEYVQSNCPSLYRKTGDESLKADIAALQGASMAALGQSAAGLEMLDGHLTAGGTATPLFWLTVADIAAMDGDRQRLSKARAALSAQFPEAVNNYLQAGRIRRWNSPDLLCRSSSAESAGGGLQVGAFSTREAAASLRHALEKDGFIGWIEPAGELWRVYVYDSEGKSAERLKEAGYDYSIGR